MRRVLVLLTCVVCAGSSPAMRAQGADSFALTATYDREGLPVPNWKFRIQPSGAVDYTSHHADAVVSDSSIHFQMSRTGLARLGKLLAESHGLSPCESKAKGLARMGDKTLVYAPAGGAEVRCSFNYSENKQVAQATEFLAQVSSVLEEGMTIDRLHRYDRLGLDPVLTRLAAASKDGKAPELGAIRASLQSLVADDAVLERVRMKAAQLLAAADLQ